MATSTDTAPTLRPGERLLAGRPYVFNFDLLNAYLADEAVAAAPADLSNLTDEEVSALWGAWMNAARRRLGDARVDEVGRLVCAEKDRRDSLSSAFRPSPYLLMAAE